MMRNDLQNLLIADAYRSGNYTLSSGKTSTHYVNCKPVTLSARGNYLVSNLILQYIDVQDKYVAGLTLGADPIVSGVAYASYFWSTLRGLAHSPNMTEPKKGVWDNNKELRAYLENNNCKNNLKSPDETRFYVTDYPQKFDELGSNFLKRKMQHVEHVFLG